MPAVTTKRHNQGGIGRLVLFLLRLPFPGVFYITNCLAQISSLTTDISVTLCRPLFSLRQPTLYFNRLGALCLDARSTLILQSLLYDDGTAISRVLPTWKHITVRVMWCVAMSRPISIVIVVVKKLLFGRNE